MHAEVSEHYLIDNNIVLNIPNKETFINFSHCNNLDNLKTISFVFKFCFFLNKSNSQIDFKCKMF